MPDFSNIDDLLSDVGSSDLDASSSDLTSQLDAIQEEQVQSAPADPVQDQPYEQQSTAAPTEGSTGYGDQASSPAPAEAGAPTADDPNVDPDRIAGRGGPQRDVAGAITDALGSVFDPLSAGMEDITVAARDWIDDTFQGDQLTEEEIRSNRQELRDEARQQSDEFRKQTEGTAARAVSDVLVRSVPGAALGAAETALEMGEVAGDAAKAATAELIKLATLGNIVMGEDEGGTQNPFGDNYQWANWNLGKDAIGAETTPGKVAQGILQFATIGSRLGAFRSFGAVKSTGLQRAATIFGREAATGIATDMVLSASGEGNMMNMLGEMFPAIKETFLQGLAVDSDDNPFEVMLKTTFEGGMIGGTAGVVGDAIVGWFKGAQAAQRAAAELKDEIAQQEAAMDALGHYWHGTNPVAAERIREKGFKPSVNNGTGNALGDGVYFTTDFRYANDYGSSLLHGSAEDAGIRIKKLTQDEYEELVNSELGGFNEFDFLADDQALIKKFGKDYDGVHVMGGDQFGGPGAALGDEIVIFDAKKADSLIAKKSELPPAPVLNKVEEAKVNNKNGPTTPTREIPIGLHRAAEQALANGNTARFEKLSALMDQKSEGIPYYWDDVAATFSEYWTKGTRQIPQDTMGLEGIMANVGGKNAGGQTFIVDMEGRPVAMGSYVTIDDSLQAVEGKDVLSYLVKNRDVLSREDAFIRVTRDDKTGGSKLEIVRAIGDPVEAQVLADMFDQKAVYGPDGKIVNSRPNHNRLADTKGAHQLPPQDAPVEKVVAEPKNVMASQRATEAVEEFTAVQQTQPLMTNNQILRIADADETAGAVLADLKGEYEADLTSLSKLANTSNEALHQESLAYLHKVFRTDGEIDLSKLPTEMRGDEEMLTPAGVHAVRGVMAEIGKRIYASAQTIQKIGGEQGQDALAQIKLLRNEMLAAMRMYKRVSNDDSLRLSKPRTLKIPALGEVEIPFTARTPDIVTMEQGIAKTEQTLDTIVTGLEKGTPAAKQSALRMANALELAGGDLGKIMDVNYNLGSIISGKGLKLMYNSMLSGPATHVTNTLSNAFNVLYRPVAAFVGGNAKVKKQAIAGFYSFNETLADSFKMGWETWKTNGRNVQGTKDLVEDSMINLELERMIAEASESGDLQQKAGLYMLQMFKHLADSPYLAWPSRLLTTSDEFFKVMVSRMEYNSRTMGEAIDMAQPGEPLKDVFKHLHDKHYSRNFTKNGQILDADLLAVAKETTFQTELSGAAGKFGAFINDVPGMRLFFPFVKTGHNIMVYTASHVPVLNLALKEYHEVMAGADEYAKANMRGRVAFGTAIGVAAGIMFENGQLTGNGPSDPARKKEWLRSYQPRSIKIGEYTDENGVKQTKWLDYSRIEPFGQILSAVADIGFMVKSGELEHDKGQYMIGYATYAFAMNLTNKSYMQGVIPLGRLLTPGWQGVNTLATLPLEQLNNFFPASGLRRQLSQQLTPYMQEFNSTLDRFLYQASVGVIDNGATSHDWLSGEPLQNPAGGANAYNPLKVVDRGTDVVRDALEDVEFDSSVIVKSLKGVDLSPDQISRLQQLMGEGGLHADLKSWVTKPGFREAVAKFQQDSAQGSRLKKEDALFYNEIVRRVEKWRSVAMQQLAAEFPDLQSSVDTMENERYNARRGVDQLLNLPN